mgnify:CR=1 FL=1
MEKEKFNKVYEYLNKKGVYELRSIGRALFVRAPTAHKKQELIEQIIENAVSGKVTACIGRGAPVKAERASLRTLSEIRKMVYDVNIRSEEERGMTIKLNQGEEKYLLNCVYLGVLVINGNRKNEEQREEYNEFVENIYKQVCGKEEITDNEAAGVRDKIYDEVAAFLEDYENAVFREKMAESFAQEKYPVVNGKEDSVFINLVAERLYEKILSEGEIQSYIKAPDISGLLTKAIEDRL